MIFIKKVFIIGVTGATILTAIFLAVIYIANSEYELEQIGEEIVNSTGPTVDDEGENEENVDEQDDETTAEVENPLFKEDPVKDFLSEKVNKAIELFFTKHLHIVAIGDSLTEGVGDEAEDGGYVGILNNQINYEKEVAYFENYGKRGNRTDQLLNRLEEEEIAEAISNADIVLITIGANDVMQVFKENFTNLTLEKFANERLDYENRLHSILSTMNEINNELKIYLIGFYNPFNRYFSDIDELEIIVENWNTSSRLVTEEYSNITFIPVKDLFEKTDTEYLSSDNFHPNHQGYQMIAERILEYFTSEEGEIYDHSPPTEEE